MKIALITSNYVPVGPNTKKGTEIFVYHFVEELQKRSQEWDIDLTVYCATDSQISAKIVGVDEGPSLVQEADMPSHKRVIFEQALIAKAIAEADDYDLLHFNIGNGDLLLPFARFTAKPIVVTIHYSLAEAYMQRYFRLYQNLPNVHFISISQNQRQPMPRLNYTANIYHGIHADRYAFSPNGGETIMWAGRATPEKGLDSVVRVAIATKKPAQLFAIHSKEHADWLARVEQTIAASKGLVKITYDQPQDALIRYYQQSKVFVFPITWAEPFGMVFTEAMACGTPVVTYANGSAPEIVENGVTGYVVDPQLGEAGLRRAVEQLYALPESEYAKMRLACRQRVERMFNFEKMMEQYIQVFRKHAG